MEHISYTFETLDALEQFCHQHLSAAQMVIVQLHTSQTEQIDKIFELLKAQKCATEFIPVIEEGVQTQLHFSFYSATATTPKNENFFEHDLYKAIIDSTKEGFWLLDEKLNIISINNAFANMLGYEKEEVLGKKPYELFSLVDEQQDFCAEQANSAHTSEQRTYELTFVSKSQKEIHTIVNATTIHIAHSCTRTFAFITDISEQKELEQLLLQQQSNINELNTNLKHRIEAEVEENRKKDHIMYQQARLASMGEMVASIAHQWRQPLNIIALIMQEFYISSQLGTLDREKIEKEYTRANSVLQYMSSTIDDFRTYFKHNDAGENFSVKEAVDSVLTLISKAMESNHIEILIEIPEQIHVFGHRNEFVQAIINLMNNAREAILSHGEQGLISVKATEDSENVHLFIQDSGGGIKEEDIRQIFEPYFTTKHQTQGTGLGLYMTHQIIVNNMNGSIYAENRGEGCCFCISIPKRTEEDTSS